MLRHTMVGSVQSVTNDKKDKHLINHVTHRNKLKTHIRSLLIYYSYLDRIKTFIYLSRLKVGAGLGLLSRIFSISSKTLSSIFL